METEEIQSGKRFNLRLEARLKNGNLVGAREILGMSAKAVAREIGFSYSSYISYENMKRRPILERRQRICQYFSDRGVFLTESEVFPEELDTIIQKTGKFVVEREIPMGLIPYSRMEQGLLPAAELEIEENLKRQELIRDIGLVLSGLPYRQEQILRAYFGIGMEEKTIRELSKEQNCSPKLINFIKNKALFTLRRPPFRKTLTPYLENSLLREHRLNQL